MVLKAIQPRPKATNDMRRSTLTQDTLASDIADLHENEARPRAATLRRDSLSAKMQSKL